MLFFEIGTLIGLEIAKHTGLAGQQVQGNLSVFVAPTLVLQASTTMAFFFFPWVWRSNLGSHACRASTLSAGHLSRSGLMSHKGPDMRKDEGS